MKIIFESEEEKENFFDNFNRIQGCPHDINSKAPKIDCYDINNCKECLKKHIPYEVKTLA
jgi:hypothetical protein